MACTCDLEANFAAVRQRHRIRVAWTILSRVGSFVWMPALSVLRRRTPPGDVQGRSASTSRGAASEQPAGR